MRKVLIFLAFVYTVLLNLRYIIGVYTTPAGYVFLGNTLNYHDYFYYLSQFTQGATRWITAFDLFTSEFKDATWVGFTNVIVGRIGFFLGLSPIFTYQLAYAVFLFLFLLCSILFLEQVFPKNGRAQCIAFLFLCLANVYPDGSTFWYNPTEPFIRFTHVPHVILGILCVIVPFYLFSRRSRLIPFIFALCGFVLANINPVQWALVTVVLGITAATDEAHARKESFMLVSSFVLGGLPMIVYLRNLFQNVPYSQISAFEGSTRIQMSVRHFLLSFGPVTTLALIGIPPYLLTLTRSRRIVLFYFICSIALFLTPVASYVGTAEIRFLSAITVLTSGIIAANVITSIGITHKTVSAIFFGLFVLVSLGYLGRIFILQLNGDVQLLYYDSYNYITRGAFDAFGAVKNMTSPRDVILVTEPYDRSFVALTGRRGFTGHELLTIRPDQKLKIAQDIVAGKYDSDELSRLFKNYGITYLLLFSGNTVAAPFLHAVYDNGQLTLYNVSL